MKRKPSSGDAIFVRQAKRGDEAAFRELVSRYHDKLRLYLRHLTLAGDECDDILQEVFVKAYRALSRFDGRRRFSPWVYRIAHNEAINYLKKKSRRRLVSWEDIASSKDELDAAQASESLEDIWASEEDRDRVKRALEVLPGPYREVLVLRYYLEKSYAEMSEILGKPENTVASMLSRAKKKLGEILVKK